MLCGLTVPTMLWGKFVFVEQQRLHMNFGKIIGNCNPIWLATSMEKHNLSTKFDERASKERKSEFFCDSVGLDSAEFLIVKN